MNINYIATINLEIEDEIDEIDLREDPKKYMDNRILELIKEEIIDEIKLLKIDSKLFLDGKEVKE